MNCVECEFYLRSRWPSADGRWPILQQDENSLIIGSESVWSPFHGKLQGSTDYHRQLNWGQVPEWQNLSWWSHRQGFRHQGASWTEAEHCLALDPSTRDCWPTWAMYMMLVSGSTLWVRTGWSPQLLVLGFGSSKGESGKRNLAQGPGEACHSSGRENP